MMKLRTKALSLMAVITALGGMSAHAFTFMWTGAAGGNWYDAGNWTSDDPDADRPSQGTNLGTHYPEDFVIFDSETSVGGVMPTGTIIRDSDWFGSGLSDHLQPTLEVRNGTINYGSGEWWFYAGASQGLIIGDGDMGTMAQVNSTFTNWTRHSDRGGPNLITINADGIFNQTSNFTFSTGGGNDAQVTINGGTFISTGTITNLVTGDLDDRVSFTALGGSFTAPFGGDFTFLTDVTNAFGAHFINNSGQTMTAVDNGNSTFTVSIVPEPSAISLLAIGGLALVVRRRRH